MKSLFKYLFVALGAGALFVSCIKTEGTGGDPGNLVETGDPVPEFTVADKDGNSFASSAMAGKRCFIFFFQTTCPDCQKVFPEIEKVWQDLIRDGSYVFLAINRGQQSAAIDEYFTDKLYTMHYYLDPDRETFRKFAKSYVPRFYVIDASGIIEWMAIESLPSDLSTAEALLALIKKS